MMKVSFARAKSMRLRSISNFGGLVQLYRHLSEALVKNFLHVSTEVGLM